MLIDSGITIYQGANQIDYVYQGDNLVYQREQEEPLTAYTFTYTTTNNRKANIELQSYEKHTFANGVGYVLATNLGFNGRQPFKNTDNIKTLSFADNHGEVTYNLFWAAYSGAFSKCTGLTDIYVYDEYFDYSEDDWAGHDVFNGIPENVVVHYMGRDKYYTYLRHYNTEYFDGKDCIIVSGEIKDAYDANYYYNGIEVTGSSTEISSFTLSCSQEDFVGTGGPHILKDGVEVAYGDRSADVSYTEIFPEQSYVGIEAYYQFNTTDILTDWNITAEKKHASAFYPRINYINIYEDKDVFLRALKNISIGTDRLSSAGISVNGSIKYSDYSSELHPIAPVYPLNNVSQDFRGLTDINYIWFSTFIYKLKPGNGVFIVDSTLYADLVLNCNGVFAMAENKGFRIIYG